MSDRKHRICPWWLGYFLAGPVRRLFLDPEAMLMPHVTEGMLVLDVGCGMGFFSLPLAKLVGRSGHVICIDLQSKMIGGLMKRAGKSGLSDRIDARVSTQDHLPLDGETGKIDFALAFAVVHEVPDKDRLFAEICNALKRGARLLLAEPGGHVREKEFEETIRIAVNAGFETVDRPTIRGSRTVVLRKK